MASLQRPAFRRLGAALLAVLIVGFAAASCRGVFGLDDFQASGEALCETLTKCYADRSLGECSAHVDGGLLDGSSEARASWLAAFSDRACLESCASARLCLDLLPVCSGAACLVKEDCCGFVTGRSDCDTTEGHCCRKKGISCTTDDDCCPGEGKCSDVTSTCGGVTCLPPQAVCLDDYRCCTGRCIDFHCAETICAEDGFDCSSDDECCSAFCDPGSKRCGKPSCVPVGGACDDPGVVCCEPAVCHEGVVCSEAACFPPGLDCVTDAQCCSKYCDPEYFLCGTECKADGAMCSAPEECCGGGCKAGVCESVCSTTTCSKDADCCTGSCVFEVCAPTCAMTTCNHGVCEIGEPLRPECSADPCVGTMCGLDPYCCCVTWDALCITEANAACGGLCP